MSEQTVPNYLFVRSVFRSGDRVLLISSQNERIKNSILWLTKAIEVGSTDVQTVYLANPGDEERYMDMVEQFRTIVRSDEHYIVNLTGGTKLMSMAVKQVFEGADHEFYYLPLPKNKFVSIDGHADIPIEHRLSVPEYLSLYGRTIKSEGRTTTSEDYTLDYFDSILAGMSTAESEVINLLRAGRPNGNGIYPKNGGYRNIDKDIDNVRIEQKTESKAPNGCCNKPQIPNLGWFLQQKRFPCHTQGRLSKYEIQYLTGGWFEELIYNAVKRYVQPNDLRLGLDIDGNELDVIFSKGNKLFTIECKSGLVGIDRPAEVVYKISAVRDSIRSLGIKSAFVALDNDADQERIAKLERPLKTMQVSYIGTADIADPKRLEDKLLQFTGNTFD